jgi:hypothetical protein
MKKRLNPQVVFTLAFVIGLLLLVVVRNNGGFMQWSKDWVRFTRASSPSGPEDVVYSMLDAQRAGDAKAYVNAFSGPIRDQLQQVVKEESASKFASYLVRSSDFRGAAVAVTERPTPEDALVRVEYVYNDRNELQNLRLKREGTQWRIIQVVGSEQNKGLFPFGAPVND